MYGYRGTRREEGAGGRDVDSEISVSADEYEQK